MTARHRLLVLASVVFAVAALAGCGSGDDRPDTARPLVVATTTQVGDLARAVAGDRAEVRQILSANSDPHAYEPRPSDVEAVTGADIVLRSGGDLDDWLEGVLDNAGSGAKTVTLLDSVQVRRPGDPHWWQDPRNAENAVVVIHRALVAADPDGRPAYDANAVHYVRDLRRMDTAIAACMRSIPARRRKLVTDHDALGYYAGRYDIDVIGTVIPALSTQAQASGGEVARLVRTIRREGVKTIFSESSANPKLTRAIARDAGAKLGPALYADSLGPEGSAGETVLGSLRANTLALADGFSGGSARCQL
ncbi:MAG TPA: metal ABC transporter substrate-binding protein [Solirubrobacteraceae bacterium]|nr:metal ABC transporter substrate-binding protein [Solirubrobacteraceae bacterium]